MKRPKKDPTLTLLQTIHEAASKTKAIEPVVLDVRKKTSYTDYLVILGGSSHRQVNAIAQRITEEVTRRHQKHPLGREGGKESIWVLIDYGDVVCHVFLEEARAFYRLEKLWHDARKIHLEKKRRKLTRRINVSHKHPRDR